MTEQEKLSERQMATLLAVQRLYLQAEREMGKWMWKNHVQWVASEALELAKKYQANLDLVYAGALLHDLADVWMERDDKDFEKRSEAEARKILQQTGFLSVEIAQIISEIIAPHSCFSDNLPVTLEAKILATADGLAHFLTDFYQQFEQMGQPFQDKKQFRAWAREKIVRDFNNKILFADEQKEAQPYFEKLKKYFESGEEK